MADLALDRMAIEEAGPDPERLAAAIHKQLPLSSGPVPVEAIARALDITGIRYEELKSFEGALIAPPERGSGTILVNDVGYPPRHRFTVAHELGHFLNPTHEPFDEGAAFICTADDLRTWRNGSLKGNRHRRQEEEANLFGIELLAPYSRVRRFLSGILDLAKPIRIADALGLSQETAARRYVDLRDQPCALVFTEAGIIRDSCLTRGFPALAFSSGERVGLCVVASGLSELEKADPRDWLRRPKGEDLVIQTFAQRDGFATTLLSLGTGVLVPPEPSGGAGPQRMERPELYSVQSDGQHPAPRRRLVRPRRLAD